MLFPRVFQRFSLVFTTLLFLSWTALAAQEYGDVKKRSTLHDYGQTEDLFQENLLELEEKLQQSGTVEVIVGLDVAIPNTLVGDSSIYAAQETFLSLLESPVRLVRRFETIPFIAIEVNLEQLRKVGSLDMVTSINLNRASNTLLASATPLISGTPDDLGGFDGTGQMVAILDTGVERSHDYFQGGKVRLGACFSTNNEEFKSACANRATVLLGPNAAKPCNNCGAHGTHVAGIAAGNNLIGPNFGVARGSEIIAVQVFSVLQTANDFEELFFGKPVKTLATDYVAALEYVLRLSGSFPIAAVNMSIGGGATNTPCDELDPAATAIINRLASVGVATVIAAGNESHRNMASTPGCISTAITVGAVDDNDNVAEFSNISRFVDLLAPGVDITSADLDNSETSLNGTSMAAPMVAGAVAVLKQKNPEATVDEIVQTLSNTGKLITDRRSGGMHTTPRINVEKALEALPTRPAGTFNDAVNNNQLGFNNFLQPEGFFRRQWYGTAVSDASGGLAARTGVTPSNGFTRVSTTVTGPGHIQFRWKVSSEVNKDHLVFSIGDREVARISDLPWSLRREPIPDGTHLLSWTYEKDASGAAGQDAGFLDDIVFEPTVVASSPIEIAAPAFITVPPVAGEDRYLLNWAPSTTSGIPITYIVQEATNPEFTDNLRIVNENNCCSQFVTTPDKNGMKYYRVRATSDGHIDSPWVNANRPINIIRLGSALDNEQLGFRTNTGLRNEVPRGWYGVNSVFSDVDDRDAALTGSVEQNQETKLETTVVGPGRVSFVWSVNSAEGFDFLKFFVDEQEKARISGLQGFQPVSVEIPEGEHVLKWNYIYTSLLGSGNNRGAVDKLLYEKASGLEPPAAVNADVDTSGNILLTWSRLSSDSGVIYVVQESTSERFVNPTEVYRGAEASTLLSSRTGQRFYYRIRAEKENREDSPWQNVSSPVDTRVSVACIDPPTNSRRAGSGQLMRIPLRSNCLQSPNLIALAIPADASAALLNVTAVSPAAPGFVTVFPCGTRPTASNLNYIAGDVIPNGVIAPLSAAGEVCIFTQSESDLVVDVAGWLQNRSFNGIVPQRLVDTRIGLGGKSTKLTPQADLRVKVSDVNVETTQGINITIPAAVQTVSLNITATNTEGDGFVTVYPCDVTRPLASNLNYFTGLTIANGVTAPLSSSGEVCFYSSTPTDLIVDVAGWFEPGAFQASTPTRLVDTRDGTGAPTQKLNSSAELAIKMVGTFIQTRDGEREIPTTATAVSLNVTTVNPEAAGFVTIWPCSADRPLASNLNFVANQIIANNVIAPLGEAGGVCFYASQSTDIVVDVSGYFESSEASGFVGAVPKRVVDTRDGTGPVPQ